MLFGGHACQLPPHTRDPTEDRTPVAWEGPRQAQEGPGQSGSAAEPAHCSWAAACSGNLSSEVKGAPCPHQEEPWKSSPMPGQHSRTASFPSLQGNTVPPGSASLAHPHALFQGRKLPARSLEEDFTVGLNLEPHPKIQVLGIWYTMLNIAGMKGHQVIKKQRRLVTWKGTDSNIGGKYLN